MIVHKNPISVETESVIPDNGEGYEDVYVVDKNSDLGQKILEHAPHFVFVLDDGGNLIDIEPTERPPSPPPEPTPIERLEEENKLLKAQSNALSERADFVEDLIAEMAMLIYP